MSATRRLASPQSAASRLPSTQSATDRPPSSASKITAAIVVDDELRDCRRLLRLFQSCYGPLGKKQSVKGDDSDDAIRAFTSASSRLTTSLRIKNPFNSLVVGGIRGQVERHRDGGCLTALLTLHLTTLWRDEANSTTGLSTALAAEMLEAIFDRLIRFAVEALTFRLDVASCRDLACIVRSVLTSNSIFFNADSTKVDHVVALVLKIFVTAIRDRGDGGDGGEGANSGPRQPAASFSMPHVEFRHVYGLNLDESSLRDGVILVAPNEWQDSVASETGLSVAIFDISLSGDCDDEFLLPNATSTTYASSRFVDVATFLRKAREFLDILIDRFEVCVVMSQRVIHPQLQSHLRSRGIRFVQRLSAYSTIPICRISGAKLISSINVVDGDVAETGVDALRNSIGKLSQIEKVQLLDNKDYLLLRGVEGDLSNCSSSSSVQTLILCLPTEEYFLEAESLVRASLAALKTAVVDSPLFVDGGGCFLANLRAHLLSNGDAIANQMKVDLRLSTKLSSQRGVDVVAEALKRVVIAMTSTELQLRSVFGATGHNWIVDTMTTVEGERIACVCHRKSGLWSLEDEVVETDDAVKDVTSNGQSRVVDSFQAVTDAMRSAFQLSAILIHTNKIIMAQ